MSTKKRSKGKNSNYQTGSLGSHSSTAPTLQKDEKSKRLSPAARNVLLGDLVFLALLQLLFQLEVLSDDTANILSFLALLIFFWALWLQFRYVKDGKDTNSRGPSL